MTNAMPAGTAGGNPPAIEASGLVKTFGGVVALDGASFSANVGEVHALVGENGAGKSTLIKILGGRLRPDTGVVRYDGRPVVLRSPTEAHRLGAATVFQELTLFPGMTLAENLLIGREPRGALGLIDRRRTVVEASRILAELGLEDIDPAELVEDVSLAQRQIIEIVRAVLARPRIIFLDEPTSSLVEREVAWLFELVRRLRSEGSCIIFTSHRWREIASIADRITVFRNAREVGTFEEISEDEAVSLMVGRKVSALYPELPPAPKDGTVLSVERLSGHGLNDVSLSVSRGEILGVGGLAGHGHRELFFTLFGALKPTGGQISVDGRPVKFRSPRDAIRARPGIALVPEDRKTEGLLLPLTVRTNLTLSVLRRIARLGLVSGTEERGLTDSMIRALDVRPPDPTRVVGTLSGGNQQKVLIGRWLLAETGVLLFYDVTRGVDVATKHEIYALINRLAREGRAIVFYSSDAEELAHLSHRVLVMREGRVAAELRPPMSSEDIVSSAVREIDAA
jgi:ribose transport system ATP-binding protein